MVVLRDEINLMGKKGTPKIFPKLSPNAKYYLTIYKVPILYITVACKHYLLDFNPLIPISLIRFPAE